MFSWKVWMTFVIVCISCVESRHSNSCISSTAIQPGLLVAGWGRSWSHDIRYQGSLSIPCTFVHFSFILRVTRSTFGKCLPIQFSDIIRISLFTFVKCPPRIFFCFLNIFWYFACRALFCYFLTHYFFSFFSCLPSYQRSLSVLWLTYFPFFHHCLCLCTDLSLTQPEGSH